jgi:excinuclease ABC subunit C
MPRRPRKIEPAAAPPPEDAPPPVDAPPAADAPPAQAQGEMSPPPQVQGETPPPPAQAQAQAVTPPQPTLVELLERLPTEPGVYLMKDKKGKIIYVGKAQSLRSRVRSYFSKSRSDGRPFVALLERLIGDIETIVTSNEKEALLLENTLIKQHRPRFNVKLVDDKNYLVLRLDERADYPRLEVMRRIRDDGARYFGPYHSATSCRQTLEVVNRHFKLRTCTDVVMKSRRRPCLQYQIKRCDAPCVFPVDRARYAEQARDVALFLDGKDTELVRRLRERMMAASAGMEYEVAAAVRDQLRALEKTLQEQHMVSAQFVDQDVFGLYREGDALAIAVLHVRQGKLIGRRAYHFSGQEFPDEESLSAFVGLYYDMGNVIPDEVLLPIDIEDAAAKAEWLREQVREKGQSGVPGGTRPQRRKVEVLAPRRGPRRRLIELANKNAAVAYKTRRDKRRDAEETLAKLERRLLLKRPPRRIECFDISHMQGSHTVASMVVFIDGEPARKEYRTFNVKSVKNDDFAAMYEVLSRRLRRGREALAAEAGDGAPQGQTGQTDQAEASSSAPAPVNDVEVQESGGEPQSGWALPDLLVIDGGKGQLGSALAAMKDVGIDPALLDVVALAKEREIIGEGEDAEEAEREPDRVFLPKVKDPIRLRPNTAELYLLSRIRDEAHRFAVTFHGKQRARKTIRSELSEIPGVGPQRQKELLRAFGSARRVRAATLEELLAVKGMSRKVAEAVVAYFGDESRARGEAQDPAPAAPAEDGPAREAPGAKAAPQEEGERDENDVLRELAALDLEMQTADTATAGDLLPADIDEVVAAASRVPDKDEDEGEDADAGQGGETGEERSEAR